jgi:hypothetical protein
MHEPRPWIVGNKLEDSPEADVLRRVVELHQRVGWEVGGEHAGTL